MVVRNVERCPACGTIKPWRKYASKLIRGERVNYVKCRVCGRHETVVYRNLVPERGTK